ncbi:MAG: monofunctional biosynthetic peptidoglycan transglycosylase [Oceanospirillaceae bacterium]
MFKKLQRFLLKALLGCFIFSIFWVFIYKYTAVVYTPLMAIRYIENTELTQIKHQWVPMAKIANSMRQAVVSAEDQRFFKHSGFDYQAIKAAIVDYNHGKPLRGGSTISQQTAKNVFLWPQRSWLRKGLEVWFTFLIEILWSKQRILEVYLNSIEMGNGIFGVQSAASYWFNRSASQLTYNQAAAIAAILPNPIKYSAHPPSRYIEQRIRWIRQHMHNKANVNH